MSINGRKQILVSVLLAGQSDGGVVQKFNGLRWVSAVVNARAEEGERLAHRPVGERVEQAHVVCIVEGHPPLVTVQEDPQPLRHRAQLEPRPGLRAGPALVPVAHPQGPVTVLRAQLDPTHPVYGLGGHAHIPFGFGTHFHLPVMSARLETLGGQDVNTLEEALVVVWIDARIVHFQRRGFVHGDVDAPVGRVIVKCYRGRAFRVRQGSRNSWNWIRFVTVAEADLSFKSFFINYQALKTWTSSAMRCTAVEPRIYCRKCLHQTRGQHPTLDTLCGTQGKYLNSKHERHQMKMEMWQSNVQGAEMPKVI